MKLFFPIYESLASVIIICLDRLIHRFNLFIQYQTIVLIIGVGLLILAAISVYLLSRKRGFGNYCKSLNDSCRLRSFLRQQNTINDFTSKAKVNLDQRIYNSALWYTYIDYAEDSMEVRVFAQVILVKVAFTSIKEKRNNARFGASACRRQKR